MQVAAAQLQAHLDKGLRQLYTVHGDTALLVQEAVDAIRARARAAGYTERSSFTVSGARFDWGGVLAASGSLSLFADRQLLELHIPTGKPGKEGSAALQQLIEGLANQDSTLAIVTLPRLDKLTKSGAWFAALEGHGVTVAIEPVERQALPQWIAQRLGAVGLRVVAGIEGQRSLQFFADCVEGNLLAAHQEVQKLALLYPAGELSFEQIEAAVMNVARYDVFKLGEAVLAGQAERVQRMLDGLQAEGQAEVLVHYTLAEDIRALKRAKDALGQGRPLPVVLREQRIWGARERLFERVLPGLDPRQLDTLLQAAHVVDGIVKGLRHPDWPHSGWLALQRLAQDMCRACNPAPTPPPMRQSRP